MKKILVVDDDKVLRAMLNFYLGKHGYVVKDVSSAIEALAVIESDEPDLIISDVMMPEMDGLEFCRQLRATTMGQLIPFIFLSAKGELEDRIQGHIIGADDYLKKPFEARELVAKIEVQLARSERIHCEILRLMQKISSPSPAERVSCLPETPSSAATLELNSYSSTLEPLPLTPAEARVFWEVIRGVTNKQISEKLFISPRTVQTHLSNILGKLGLENRSQLVRFAYEQGYKTPEAQ